MQHYTYHCLFLLKMLKNTLLICNTYKMWALAKNLKIRVPDNLILSINPNRASSEHDRAAYNKQCYRQGLRQ